MSTETTDTTKAQSTAHTGGRWRVVGGARSIHGASILSEEGPGIYIALLSGDHPDTPANARFIVRACNAHDELVEALEEASHWFEGEHHPDHPTCVKIRAALARARGETT